jgi:hypothetical protein
MREFPAFVSASFSTLQPHAAMCISTRISAPARIQTRTTRITKSRQKISRIQDVSVVHSYGFVPRTSQPLRKFPSALYAREKAGKTGQCLRGLKFLISHLQRSEGLSVQYSHGMLVEKRLIQTSRATIIKCMLSKHLSATNDDLLTSSAGAFLAQHHWDRMASYLRLSLG